MEKRGKRSIESNNHSCFDVREKFRPLTNPQDIYVDDQTFFVLCQHVEEGFYSRGIKYHGVVFQKNFRGDRSPNCVNQSYTNFFVNGSVDGFFHVYVIPPSLGILV